MNERKNELNIQPQAGVIGVFSRLSYKAWYAIAEFVDNSTQSFFSNRAKLRDRGQECVRITIQYDSLQNTLTITDDAFGMGYDNFVRAVKLDSKPIDKSGRNEFGMGLKTAASWFGDVWSIESTELGSTVKYNTEVNIPVLRLEERNSIFVFSNECDADKHGTTITIREVTKRIDGRRTIGKIRKVLESMYRRDIAAGEVEIVFNEEELVFDEYEPLPFRDKEWKKNIAFETSFRGNNYRVKGFVGVLKNGSFSKAGFALFRRNRVVIGGEDMNYKPQDIFGQLQSTISHKLYGELDLDDFEINQAKDGFIWDDGLEDEFVAKLKENIQEYIEIAKLTIKERAKESELSDSVSDDIQQSVQSSIGAEPLITESPVQGEIEETIEFTSDMGIEPGVSDIDIYRQAILSQSESQSSVEASKTREYTIQLNTITKIKVSVKWEIGQKDKWVSIFNYADRIDVTININHPFFKPYSEDKGFKEVLEKFVIAFALAEREAKVSVTDDGYILDTAIQTNLNKFLERLSTNVE